MQIRGGRGTDALRVPQTYILPLHGQIEIKFPVVRSCVAAQSDQPSTGMRGERFDLQAVVAEYQRAVYIAQSAGQIAVSDKAARDLQPALGEGLRHSAGNRDIHCDQSGRDEVRIEALDELEVGAALSPQIELTFSG